MLKPYDVGELQARLRALTRRAAPETTGSVVFAELELDPLIQAVRVGELTIELTHTELELLALLMSSPRRTLRRRGDRAGLGRPAPGPRVGAEHLG